MSFSSKQNILNYKRKQTQILSDKKINNSFSFPKIEAKNDKNMRDSLPIIRTTKSKETLIHETNAPLGTSVNKSKTKTSDNQKNIGNTTNNNSNYAEKTRERNIHFTESIAKKSYWSPKIRGSMKGSQFPIKPYKIDDLPRQMSTDSVSKSKRKSMMKSVRLALSSGSMTISQDYVRKSFAYSKWGSQDKSLLEKRREIKEKTLMGDDLKRFSTAYRNVLNDSEDDGDGLMKEKNNHDVEEKKQKTRKSKNFRQSRINKMRKMSKMSKMSKSSKISKISQSGLTEKTSSLIEDMFPNSVDFDIAMRLTKILDERMGLVAKDDVVTEDDVNEEEDYEEEDDEEEDGEEEDDNEEEKEDNKEMDVLSKSYSKLLSKFVYEEEEDDDDDKSDADDEGYSNLITSEEGEGREEDEDDEDIETKLKKLYVS